MKQYIDKAAIMAEIERLYNLEYTNDSDLSCGKKIILRYILSFLDTLEAKKVDLLKEIANQYENYEDYLLYEEFADIAKYFFELGLKAQKGE